MITIANYIGGAMQAPVSNKYIDNFNPSTGKVYSYCPDSDERDVALAVTAAHNALQEWKNTPAEKRSRIMQRIADLIEKRLDEFAQAETIDQGKPLWLSKNGEIPHAISNMQFFATAIEHFS